MNLVQNMAIHHLVEKHEGVRFTVYTDTRDVLTIGIGFNLQKEGAKARITALGVDYAKLCTGACALSEAQVYALFAIDLQDCIDIAPSIVRNFNKHPGDIQAVIVDMIYNLGPRGFQGFANAIDAFEAEDYSAAAAHMQDSAWARQVPNRAAENIAIVRRYCQ